MSGAPAGPSGPGPAPDGADPGGLGAPAAPATAAPPPAGAPPGPDTGAAPPGWRRATPVVLLAAGLLLTVTARTSHGSDLRAGRSTRLADVVTARQQEVADRAATAARLRAAVQALTARTALGDAGVAAVDAQAQALQAAAGLTPMTGAAVRVVLDDAPRGARVAPGVPAPGPDDLVVHQQDVQAVVNALWASGAQGLTLQGQRVVGTTAVRCVGNTLLLAGRVYSPPYVVTAVGDPSRLAVGLDVAPAVRLYRQYVTAYGLRYQVSRLRAVTLPGYTGSLNLTYAVPVTAPPAAP